MSRVISLKDAGGWVDSLNPALSRAGKRGALAAAMRGVSTIVGEIIPRAKPTPVDRGIYRAGFRAEMAPWGAVIVNDAPHAPLIEYGVKNVKPGRAMIAALAEWARRKGFVGKGESPTAVAFAIAKNMQKKGGIFAAGAGLHVLEAAEPYLKKYLLEEVRKAVAEEVSKA